MPITKKEREEFSITIDEIYSLMKKDREWFESNPTEMDMKKIPSGIGNLKWINFGTPEKYYARALLQLRYGVYIAPNELRFNSNNLTYSA